MGKNGISMAPIAVSGVLIFVLMSGQEIINPSQQSVAGPCIDTVVNCDDTNQQTIDYKMGCNPGDHCENGSHRYMIYSITGTCPPDTPDEDQNDVNVINNVLADESACTNTTQCYRVHCIPEFPVFFPLLFSLTAPLMFLFSSKRMNAGHRINVLCSGAGANEGWE